MAGMGVTAATAAKWTERIRDWRASGLSASQYVAGKEFEASTLRYWASRLKPASTATTAPTATTPRLVELVPRSRSRAQSPSPSPVARCESDLVIEVGAVRVRVGRGFDRELLADVVGVLGGTR